VERSGNVSVGVPKSFQGQVTAGNGAKPLKFLPFRFAKVDVESSNLFSRSTPAPSRGRAFRFARQGGTTSGAVESAQPLAATLRSREVARGFSKLRAAAGLPGRTVSNLFSRSTKPPRRRSVCSFHYMRLGHASDTLLWVTSRPRTLDIVFRVAVVVRASRPCCRFRPRPVEYRHHDELRSAPRSRRHPRIDRRQRRRRQIGLGGVT